VLAVYGNFDPVEARRIIKKRFANLPEGRIELPDVKPRRVAKGGEMYVRRLPATTQQAGVMLGIPGMTVDNDDRYAVTVLDAIISGYRLPSGWLHSELRGKRLVYMVHAYNWSARVPGAFIAVAGCQPKKVPEVLGILRKNLRRASTYRPTELEVKQAVNSILTAEVLGNQSMSALAMQAALDELYGFGYDHQARLAEKYNAVTPDDVLRVAKKYLSGGYVATVATPDPDLLDSDGTKTKNGK
jgi:predicted Zn-dependent peptidase